MRLLQRLWHWLRYRRYMRPTPLPANYTEVVATVLRERMPQIAANVEANNVLFKRLQERE
jgi:hypothetical protein